MTHRVPDISYNMTGKVDAAYQAEVDRSTARHEAEYRRAEKRLAAAERLAQRKEHQRSLASGGKRQRFAEREVRVAWELVVLRRAELERIAGIMQQSPAPATARGDRSYRQVPVRHGSSF